MVTVGDYDLERQIGAGASGTVWKAHSRGSVKRVVALKRLRAGSGSSELARLRREAGLLSTIDHPNVVRVLEVIEDGDGIALAMEFAQGGSLEDVLVERGRLTAGQVVAITAPIAEALHEAHMQEVLHGDVKPANVLFTSGGQPLLSDFGVARTLGHVTSDQVTGTAAFLAPELLDGKQPDPRADVYSLAVVCYQALAGHVPYAGPAPLAVVKAADRGEHPRLEEMPWVPQALAMVVERAMARDPAQRFGSANEFARALRSSVPAGEVVVPGPAQGRQPGAEGAGTGATRDFGPRPPRRDPVEQRQRRVPLLVVAGLTAAGLIYVIRSGTASDEQPDCPNTQEPVVEDAQVVRGDPEGDGCTTYGLYRSQVVAGEARMVLTIEVDGQAKRVGLGVSGDQAFVGDWNCDGRDTPGLYSRESGAVLYYDVWPQEQDQQYQPTSTDTEAAGGTASLRRGSGNVCDQVQVTPPP